MPSDLEVFRSNYIKIYTTYIGNLVTNLLIKLSKDAKDVQKSNMTTRRKNLKIQLLQRTYHINLDNLNTALKKAISVIKTVHIIINSIFHGKGQVLIVFQ